VAQINKRANSSAERGFTLIEITIAILVLAGSFTVILGLMASATQRAVRDRNSQSAMLMARRILAAIETNKDAPSVGVQEDSANRILTSLMPGIEENSPELDETKMFSARLTSAAWPVGDDKESLVRVSLELFWSDSPADSFYVTYFMPKNPNEEEDPDAQ
jgi:type II secretory pathway pseudopilin PulG